MQVYRIDRRNVTAVHPGVGVCVCTCAVTSIEGLVCSVYIETSLEPLHGLYVHSSTTRKTIKARGLDVTILLQITYREQVVGLISSTVGIDVVLLTETVTDSLVEPVEVLTISTLHAGGGQLTIAGKQCIVSSIVDVQVQTIGNQVLRSVGSCRSSIVAS